jgi:F-type H+-transporting ATPase subunit a
MVGLLRRPLRRPAHLEGRRQATKAPSAAVGALPEVDNKAQASCGSAERRAPPLLWAQKKKAKSHMLFSPLEQFAIIPLIPFHIGNLYLSFTNSSLFMILTVSFILLLFHFVTLHGGYLVPNAWQSFVEIIYDFVLNLVNEQISGSSSVKQRFFPFIFVTFTFLLFSNLIGMIPYSFTVTSHFIVTLGLSFSLFIGVTIVGFQTHGLHFFSLLLPQGVPLPLAPFLVLLELISYCFRALSLGIRLFANMMAGHSLVKILSGFAWTMLSMGGIMYLAHLAPLLIVFALIGLELGVAVLQAYVFTILICIYLNDAINLH